MHVRDRNFFVQVETEIQLQTPRSMCDRHVRFDELYLWLPVLKYILHFVRQRNEHQRHFKHRHHQHAKMFRQPLMNEYIKANKHTPLHSTPPLKTQQQTHLKCKFLADCESISPPISGSGHLQFPTSPAHLAAI